MDKVQDTVLKIKDAADAAIVKTETNAREVESRYKAKLNATTFAADLQESIIRVSSIHSHHVYI